VANLPREQGAALEMSEKHERDVRDEVLGQRRKPPELATVREWCLEFEEGSRPSSMREVRDRLLEIRAKCEEEAWIDTIEDQVC